jgi:hypothetical protein
MSLIARFILTVGLIAAYDVIDRITAPTVGQVAGRIDERITIGQLSGLDLTPVRSALASAYLNGDSPLLWLILIVLIGIVWIRPVRRIFKRA